MVSISKKQILGLSLAGTGMIMIIFNTHTALRGASEGIDLCVKTVIPSLFPFLVLSIYMTGQFSSLQIRWLRPLGRLLRLPGNTYLIFLVGLLGGYPTGAQCIRQAYDTGLLSKSDAQRMLCFCSNAGPAFLFGIGGRILGNMRLCWIVWGIHILAALIIGAFIPAKESAAFVLPEKAGISITEAVRRAAGVMIMICSWIVLFRIILLYLQNFLFWIRTDWVLALFSGLLEITNGCSALMAIYPESLRVVLFSSMLSFGGLCVGLQTSAVLAGSGLSIRPYFLGKAIQGMLCCLLSMLLVWKDYQPTEKVFLMLTVIVLPSVALLLRNGKLGIAFSRKMMYTEDKSPGGLTYETIPQES